MPQTDTEMTAVWGIPLLFEIKLRAYRYKVFAADATCLTAYKRFLMFKGPGSFKKSKKNCGNVAYLKAYQLIQSMAPLFNGWTITLNKDFSFTVL